MKAALTRRVKKLEAKSTVSTLVYVTFSKFDMQKSKPSRETCRKIGQRNIKAVKAMRSARAAGKDIWKSVDKNDVFLDDDSYYREDDPNMTHDDWVKLLQDYKVDN